MDCELEEVDQRMRMVVCCRRRQEFELVARDQKSGRP